MNPSPLVSVVAINFNFEKYLWEALESVKQQHYDNIELIIIDDHSRDNSVALIKEWMTTYQGPCRLIVNEKNLGVCATLNKAFAQATGKYIAAIATDDIWLPDKTSIQVQLLEAAPADVCAVYSDAYLIREDGSPRDKKFMEIRNVTGVPQGEIFEPLLTDNFIPAMSVLLKMECYQAVGNFDEQLVYEDYDMWLRLSKRYKFLFSDYMSVKYRIKDKSLSTSILWEVPNTKILLKHVDHHPLVLQKLRQLTLTAYRKDQKKVFEILSASNLRDPYIRRLRTFHRWRIPIPIGLKLLPSLPS